jgi:ABC-2 type transport system permease protein
MSVLLPYTTMHSVIVSNESGLDAAGRIVENLERLEGIRVIETDGDRVMEKLIGGNAELAVMITDNSLSDDISVNIVSVAESEIEGAIELSIKESLYGGESEGAAVSSREFKSNPVKKKWLGISNTLAFMIFKTLTTGNLLGALIISERKNKMKDRILLSGVQKSSYLLGMTFVYLFFMTLGSIFYYLVGELLHFDFGMKNSIGFLLMLIVSNVLSVSIYVFFAAFLKKEDALGFVGTFILMPMSLFAGVLFPYRFMPQTMQRIGACFPQRWIALAIEKMQKSGSLLSATKETLMVLGVSAVLLMIGITYEKNKRIRRIKE